MLIQSNSCWIERLLIISSIGMNPSDGKRMHETSRNLVSFEIWEYLDSYIDIDILGNVIRNTSVRLFLR